MKEYGNITEYYRMYSTEAAQKMARESLDFAYIDARHDYCGVREDLEESDILMWYSFTRGNYQSFYDP